MECLTLFFPSDDLAINFRKDGTKRGLKSLNVPIWQTNCDGNFTTRPLFVCLWAGWYDASQLGHQIQGSLEKMNFFAESIHGIFETENFHLLQFFRIIVDGFALPYTLPMDHISIPPDGRLTLVTLVGGLLGLRGREI